MKKNIIRGLVTFFVALVFFVFSKAQAQATDYYVSTSGNNSNSGLSVDKPFKTIQTAADIAKAGDTVYVRGGTYSEWVSVKNSGTSSAPITFKAYSGEHPIIDGANVAVPNNYGLFDVRSKDYITLDGFEVRYSYAHNTASIVAQHLIVLKDSSYDTVRNCIIHDNEHYDSSGNIISGGTSASGNSGLTAIHMVFSDHILVEHNEVYHAGRNAINSESCNYLTIQYNEVHDTPAHNCINIFPKTEDSAQPIGYGQKIMYNRLYRCTNGILLRYQRDATIANNLIYDTASGKNGIIIQKRGSFSTFTDYNYDSNIKVYNNVFVNIAQNGIQSDNAYNMYIKNNIFQDFGYTALYLPQKTGTEVNNNIYYDSSFKIYWGGNTYSSLSSWQSASGQDKNSFEADPIFKDLSGKDFHLNSSDSPAIDKGTDVGMSNDMDGTSIPQGSASDIGAYEYKDVAPAPPPAVCQLISASWSQTQATEGDVVKLNVQGDNCDGKTFNYTIKEDDGLLPDDTIASFTSTSLNPDWTTVNLGDQIGDPEYYFEVSEVGNQSNAITSSKDAELVVSKKDLSSSGLISVYDFNEGSGNILNDSVGNNNGAVSGATWISGYEGSALNFDGNDNKAIIPYSASITPKNISIAFWMKTDEDTAVNGWDGILRGAGGNGYSNGWRVLNYNNHIVLQVNFGGSVPQKIENASVSIPVNNWVHVAFTYNGNDLKLYQDGIEIASLVNTAGINWLNSDSMYFGYAQDGRNFKGILDNLQLYEKALSIEEIKALYLKSYQSDCQINSASWSKTQVYEGENVQLNTQISNCDGKMFSYTIKEDDGLLPDDTIASFTSNNPNPNWIAVNIGDQMGDPEYYFEVSEVGDETNKITSSGGELVVLKGCVDQDGDGYDTCSLGQVNDDGKKIDCNDADQNINPGATEICDDNIDNNCDGVDDICVDTIPPKAATFNVNLDAESKNKVNINWAVTDNIGLSKAEIWRAADKDGMPDNSNLEQVDSGDISGVSASGTVIDLPAVGLWWYGIKVFDQAGNSSQKINATPITIIDNTCYPENSYLSCEKDDPADLCSVIGSSKVLLRANCYKIEIDSCGEVNKTLVENTLCGKSCRDKTYNCKATGKWKEAVP